LEVFLIQKNREAILARCFIRTALARPRGFPDDKQALSDKKGLPKTAFGQPRPKNSGIVLPDILGLFPEHLPQNDAKNRNTKNNSQKNTCSRHFRHLRIFDSEAQDFTCPPQGFLIQPQCEHQKIPAFFPKKWRASPKGTLHPQAQNLKQLLLTANRNNKFFRCFNII
jgi:hypothetical protein